MFEPVPRQLDVPALEQDIIRFWNEHDVERRYLDRNQASEDRFAGAASPAPK